MHEAAGLWQKLFFRPPLATDRGWAPDHADHTVEDLRGAEREADQDAGGVVNGQISWRSYLSLQDGIGAFLMACRG